jgi:RNA polymerase sigma-70 factor (ECF subfamily)
MADDRSGAPSDDDLVRAVAAGSQDALAILYDRHAESIHRLAVRLTNDRALAEEIVQETFLALWNRAERFDPSSGSLATWLRTIARNRALDRLRAAARRPRPVTASLGPAEGDPVERLIDPTELGDGTDPATGPERAVELDELRRTLRAALRAMPDPERRVILLAYQEGLSQSEIAVRLGWPLGTVKTRTRRALQRLRAALVGLGFGSGPGIASAEAGAVGPADPGAASTSEVGER